MRAVSLAAARVYAEALLDIAAAQDNLPQIVDDLHAVQDLFHEDETFRTFYSSHRFEREFKQRVLREALEGKLCRPVMGLIHVLAGKQRELYLDNIVAEFDRFRDLREGRLHIHVTVAQPLDEEQKSQLAARLGAVTGKKIKIHEKVDPRVLGGLVVRIEDKVIDGSVRKRLETLRRAMVSVGE